MINPYLVVVVSSYFWISAVLKILDWEATRNLIINVPIEISFFLILLIIGIEIFLALILLFKPEKRLSYLAVCIGIMIFTFAAFLLDKTGFINSYFSHGTIFSYDLSNFYYMKNGFIVFIMGYFFLNNGVTLENNHIEKCYYLCLLVAVLIFPMLIKSIIFL